MKHKIYTVFDSKAEAFLPPFFMHQQGMALRVFADCCNDKEHQFGKHADDYTLFEIGEWDDEVGTLVQHKQESLANGITLVINNQEEIDK